MTSVKQTTSLLAAVFDFLNSADDGEIERLARGEAELRIVPVDEAQSQTAGLEEPRKKTNGSYPPPLPTKGRRPFAATQAPPEIDEIARQLNEADSREEAEGLVVSINVPKGKGRRDFLIQLAKACSVHVESKDAISVIERKLVEGTVGAKLRSKAFREVAF